MHSSNTLHVSPGLEHNCRYLGGGGKEVAAQQYMACSTLLKVLPIEAVTTNKTTPIPFQAYFKNTSSGLHTAVQYFRAHGRLRAAGYSPSPPYACTQKGRPSTAVSGFGYCYPHTVRHLTARRPPAGPPKLHHQQGSRIARSVREGP